MRRALLGLLDDQRDTFEAALRELILDIDSEYVQGGHGRITEFQSYKEARALLGLDLPPQKEGE